MVYTLRFFPLQNAVCFIILTYLVPVLFTFYIQSVPKLKNNSGAKSLMKLEFSRQIFKKYSGIKFNENPSSGSRVVPCNQKNGRMDGQT